MADSALSKEAMLEGLRDIRLPGDAPGGLVAEGLAALACGLLLAVLIGVILRVVTRVRPRRAVPEDPFRSIGALAEEDQRLALLRMLKARAPERYAVLAQDLYQPGGLPDVGALWAEVRRDD
ncbi:hypothetical protein [Puniceibacterium sediminis]|uniref:Uncharacterized protein n=1 Tax=Puniceibacterium sediminis TaxID=1608407 RepID=A0A238Y819_9RHOB|nr:hypothetical protein [Puniceibacterium sediminis]SNR67092.1 hypothetical protein SAMN06265370_11544 [Puniceibacterium sediminis]